MCSISPAVNCDYAVPLCLTPPSITLPLLSPQDRERETKGGSGGANWCEFMVLLARLAMAESNYYNLSFVGRSWLIMKKEVSGVHPQPSELVPIMVWE